MKGKVLFTKTNPKGFYGFIRCDDGNSYHFDSDSVIKGNYLKPNSMVEFDIVQSGNGRTEAVNVQLVASKIDYAILPHEKIVALLEVLKEAFPETGFINCSNLPELFNKASVNYKEFAADIKSFVDKYLYTVYKVEKSYTYEGKTYTRALVLNNWIDIAETTCPAINQRFTELVERNGFVTAEEVPEILKEFEIDNYRDFAETMDSFVERCCNGMFIPKKRIKINNELLPKIYVSAENADLFQEEEDTTDNSIEFSVLDSDSILSAKTILNEHFKTNDYITGGLVPDFFEKAGVENYKNYARNLEEFINLYFADSFELKRNEIRNGKCESCILVPKATDKTLEALQNLYHSGDSKAFLSSPFLQKISPLTLGVEGIQMALYMLVDYLGESRDNVKFNAFHETLITTSCASDLKQYKDNEELLELGLQSSYLPLATEDFFKIFSNIHNGKRNLNNNWNGIVERFWTAKSTLAVYLTCLTMIITKKPAGVDIYIDEAFKEHKIDKLPIVLKTYTDFLKRGNNSTSLQLKRKIIGHCLDCHDIHTLCQSYLYFDNYSLTEMAEVIEFLEGRTTIDSKVLISWFHSEIGEMITEKLTNYYWWRESRTQLSPELIKTFSTILWEYPENYFSDIVYNKSCPGFEKEQKEQIFVNNFIYLCEFTKEYEKAFLFVNYIYLKYISALGNPDLDIIWNELKTWMTAQVEMQLSPELSSACTIRLLRYDNETTQALESYYCNTYVANAIKEISTEDELDAFISQCEELNLPFITQWVVNNSENSAVKNRASHIHSLIETRRIDEAISLIQAEQNFSQQKKIKLIKECLCANFELYNCTEAAYHIFDHSIPEEFAEQILLSNISFTESLAIQALICIYAHRRDWVKALYLYVPFKVLHEDGRRQFIDEFYNFALSERVLDKNKNKKLTTHYDVIKCALKIYDSNEFDTFIEWAKKIKVPATSKKYKCEPKTFDKFIKEMLTDCNYTEVWQRLLFAALRTDNNEKQDSLRFCIITSFIGSFGLVDFEETVIRLSKNKYSTKNFTEYYISLWKGLLNGKYTANFLRLCEPLIGNAPPTFWNIFYDVSVCKNHVFSTNDFELNHWTEGKCDMQSFYDALLTRYSITRETIYVKIAANIISDCCEDIAPSFEHYIPFCSSNRNKDFLFAALIKMVAQGRYTKEITKFLKADFWRCEEEETRLIHILQAICTNETEELFDEKLKFTSDEISTFENDFIECAKNYPNIMVPKIVRETTRESRLAYKYKLMEYMLHIGIDKSKTDGYYRALSGVIPVIHENTPTDPDYICYLKFVAVLHRKQLKPETDDIVYVKNRYYRLLIGAILMETDINQFSDDEIVLLMQQNKHFTSVYPEYKEFKKHILDFVKSDSISEKLKIIFLTGVLSNNWEQFTKAGPDYSEAALKLIQVIESYTNYRDFNIQFLKEFIYDDSPEGEKNIEYVRYCSPDMYSVLKEIKKIYDEDKNNYETCRSLLVGIAYLDNPDKAGKAFSNMNVFLKNSSKELNKHWDMYIATLLSTSYPKTIINILAQKIRRQEILSNDVSRWQPVFASMGKSSVFFYLLSLKYAIERKLKDARYALSSVPSTDELPVEWMEEKARLEAYLSGEVKYFTPGEVDAIGTVSVEKEATNVSFIQTISPQHSNTANAGSNNNGANAYKSILQADNDIEDVAKYNLYRQLFTFVNNPDDLYEIYPQVDGQGQGNQKGRLTYNELVIEYGSLAIAYNEHLSADQKMDILLEIFDVYQLLNDINKAKANILNRLVSAEQSVLETPGVSFGKWLSCKKEIHQILSNEIIACSETDITKWSKPIEECLKIVKNNNTEMAILEALGQWRNSYNLVPDCPNYENAFVRAVDEKIQSLKNGVNLSLKINNTDIEDGCVFYQIKNISPYNNVSVKLSNFSKDSAHLQVSIKINNGDFEPFEGHFSNELDLRANDTCGQKYPLPQKVLEALHEGDVLTIMLNIVYGDCVICNNASQCRFRYKSYESVLTPNLIPKSIRYGTEVPAFSEFIKGFGRETEKADLRDLLEQNLAIIYGPSRAGKSSLMNFLANDYLIEYADFSGYSSFMCIRVADEQNTKKDYTQDMITGEELTVFENSTQIMEYLFLSPLKIAFGDSSSLKKARMCKVIGDSFPEAAKQEISSVLSQQGTVIEKYGVISQILSNYHCQLWLMFDEFQQIVQKWVGSADELAELCTAIRYNQTSIKLVLCGSDELVRIFECAHDTYWDEFKVKTSGALVFVGQLSDLDFGAMMNDRSIWKNAPENHPWNMLETDTVLPDVLQSLYEYTGGNAICGKLFGQEILKKLNDGYFSHRKYLYPADITHIAYEVLNSEASQIKNLLITHTTKNLQNEEPYLLYIAHELASDINRSEVSFRKICEFFTTKESTDIEAALKLLVARGILKTTQGSRKYSFATMYYFDCYKNKATDFVIKKLKSMMSRTVVEESVQPNIMDIMQLYNTLSPQDKYKILSMIYADKDLPKDEMKVFKDRITNKYRDVIETQNNTTIQINAQIINSSFTTLISNSTIDQKLEAFNKLPKLEDFYTEQEQPRMKELQAARAAIDNALNKEHELSDKDVSVIDEIENINTQAQNRYYGEMVSTMFKQSDSTPDASVFAEPTEEELKYILGIKKATQITLIKGLPQEYYRQLCFAIALHKMILPNKDGKIDYEEIEKIDYSDVDFSPISIMYCKLVESMLKDKHLELYGAALPEATIPSGETFKKLNEKETRKNKWKNLTIGTFVWHLIVKNVSITEDGVQNKSYFDSSSNPKINKNPNLDRLSKFTEKDIEDWRIHARALAEILEIRNMSAHGGNTISKPVFEHLLKVLFTDGEGAIIRLLNLAQE